MFRLVKQIYFFLKPISSSSFICICFECTKIFDHLLVNCCIRSEIAVWSYSNQILCWNNQMYFNAVFWDDGLTWLLLSHVITHWSTSNSSNLFVYLCSKLTSLLIVIETVLTKSLSLLHKSSTHFTHQEKRWSTD